MSKLTSYWASWRVIGRVEELLGELGSNLVSWRVIERFGELLQRVEELFGELGELLGELDSYWAS